MCYYAPTGMKLRSYSLQPLKTDNSRINFHMVITCVSPSEPLQRNKINT